MESCIPPAARACTASAPRAGSDPGITLLELMAVLAIIAILALLAMPDMSGLIRKNDLYQQTDKLALAIMRTRDLAMEDACTWRMVFQPGKGSWTCYGDADDDGQLDAGERSLGPYILEKGISFGSRAGSGPNGTSLPGDGVSFVDDRISFSPMGCCNSGSVYLTDGRHGTALRVMPASGSVKVWRLLNGSWRGL